MAGISLADIFANMTRPEDIRAQQQALYSDMMSQMNSGERFGFNLANLFGNIMKRAKSGAGKNEDGSDRGFIQRVRAGDSRSKEEIAAASDENAITRAIAAAGGTMEGELPEQADVRMLKLAQYELMQDSNASPEMIQQVTAALRTAEISARQAAYDEEDRDFTKEARNLEMEAAREELAIATRDNKLNYWLNPNNGVYGGSFNPENLDPAQKAMMEANGFTAVTREEALAGSDAQRAAVLASERQNLDGGGDMTTVRRYTQQNEAGMGFGEIIGQTLDIVLNQDTEQSVNTFGATLDNFANSIVTQVDSLTGGAASSLLRSGDRRTVDGSDFNMLFEEEMRGMAGENWFDNSVWADSMDKNSFLSLMQRLSYLSARQLDPSGRLSDFDVQIQAKILGTALKDPSQLFTTLTQNLQNSLALNMEQSRRYLEAYDQLNIPRSEVADDFKLLRLQYDEMAGQLEKVGEFQRRAAEKWSRLADRELDSQGTADRAIERSQPRSGGQGRRNRRRGAGRDAEEEDFFEAAQEAASGGPTPEEELDDWMSTGLGG